MICQKNSHLHWTKKKKNKIFSFFNLRHKFMANYSEQWNEYNNNKNNNNEAILLETV